MVDNAFMNIEMETFINFDFGEDIVFPIIVVYNSPDNFKDKFVARLFDVDKPTAYIVPKNTLQEVIDIIPANFVFTNRLSSNNSHIECLFIGGR